MNLISKKIEEIKSKEGITTAEVFLKYPHLAELLMQEQQEREKVIKEKQLLKG